MAERVLTPTAGQAIGAWQDVANALGNARDGRGAYNTGAGPLWLGRMHGRDDLDHRDSVVGIAIHLRARARASRWALDSFTAPPGTRLDHHTGETGAAWHRPFTLYDPAWQRINASGRTYHAGQNGSGPTTNGAEHYLASLAVPGADYYVEARFHAATDGGPGETAELHVRAALPATFYYLQYDEGTDEWRLGRSAGAGVRTVLATYGGDAIAPGASRLARLAVNGTTLSAVVDGVERMTATDAAVTAAGFPGFRLTPGSARQTGAIVTAMHDLGSPQVVTRAVKRVGYVDASQTEFTLEASHDGLTWVNAYTGPPFALPPGSGVFTWAVCHDTSSVTTTAYRYWRTHLVDTGAAPEPRIGDFRLWVGGVPAVYAESRFGHRHGAVPHTWPEGAATALLTDNAQCDTTTSVGGVPAGDPHAWQGMQCDSFEVGSTAVTLLAVRLTADGSTPRGHVNVLTLGPDYTEHTIGGPNDLLGTSWTIGDIRTDAFGVLLERGSGASEAEVDALQAIIYVAVSGGPNRMLREQVRQQIIIGRESGTNEVQTLAVSGAPTGGTFRLTFNGVETGPIAHSASAAVVQAALEAVSSIGSGNVACSGGPLPGSGVVVTFVRVLGASPQNLITVTSAAFTGGTSPAGSVTRSTAGVRAVGAGATPNVRLRHVRIQPQPAAEFMAHRPAGEKLPNHQVVLKESAEGPVEGVPTYDEFGWLLSGVVARPNTSTLQAGAAFRHVFALDNRERDGIATFQAEYGDQFARAHRVRGMVVNAIDLALRQDGIDLGGSVFARQIEDGVTMAPGAATVQTLSFSGPGVFRLRYKGQETGDLDSATMTSAAVQTALRALPSVNGSTQLTVTGAASPYTVTFGNAAGGPFLGMPQPLMDVRIISGTPAVTVAMTTRGGYVDYPGHVILPRHVEFFLTPSLALLASSKLANVFSTGLSIGNKNAPVYNLDRAESSWANYAEGSTLDVKFGLIAEATAPAMQFLSQARSDATLFLRILATGALIGSTAFPHRLQIDCPVKVGGFGPFAENQDVYAFEYELVGVQDDATNTSLVVTLDNAVSAY